MKRRFPLALLSAAVAIAIGAMIGGASAAPLSNGAFGLSFSNGSILTKVDYACGWTAPCVISGNDGKGPNVIVYGQVNVFSGADVKPEPWRVPEGAWPWTGDQSEPWRGVGCGGYPCTEKCGAFCWFHRIRNGYCGHGCDAYREHVMFQPIGGTLKPFVYRDPLDGELDYGSPNGSPNGYACRSGGAPGPNGYCGSTSGSAPAANGYGYSSGSAPASNGYGYGPASAPAPTGYGYGPVSAPAPNGYAYGSGRASYGGTSAPQGYYPTNNGGGAAPPTDYSQNGSYGSPPSGGERFIDRLRRYFYGRQTYRDSAAVRDNGPIQFERPSNDLTPLRRFNGPKYPPNCTGKNC